MDTDLILKNYVNVSIVDPVSKIVAVILFIYFIIVCVYLYMHMYNFLWSDSLLKNYTSFSFFLF